MGGQLGPLAQPAHEGASQQRLVLHGHEAAHGAHQPVAAGLEGAAVDGGGGTGRKAPRIHAVADEPAFRRRHTHRLAQVAVQVGRHRDEAAHEGRVGAAQPAVLGVAALRVVRVPAVFDVDAPGHARGPGHGHHLQRRQIAGVQHVGADLAQQAPDRRVLPERVAGRFVERDEAHALALHALAEVAHRGQREHHVLEAVGRQAVDELHDDVLQSTDVEAVDHVKDAQTLHTLTSCRRRKASNIISIHSGVAWSLVPRWCSSTRRCRRPASK